LSLAACREKSLRKRATPLITNIDSGSSVKDEQPYTDTGISVKEQ